MKNYSIILLAILGVFNSHAMELNLDDLLNTINSGEPISANQGIAPIPINISFDMTPEPSLDSDSGLNLISQPDYEKSFHEVIDLGNSILEKISAEANINDYIIIGVGRSPSLVMAYFQECLKLNARNIPLSSFRGKGDDNFLNTKLENKLFDHIDVYLPNLEKVAENNKRILIIDFGHTGDSLKSFSVYLQKYLRVRKNIDEVGKIETFLMNNNSGLSELKNFSYFLNLDAEGYTNMSQIMDGQGFDLLSEFGIFYVDSDKYLVEKRESRTSYLELKRKIFEICNNDKARF